MIALLQRVTQAQIEVDDEIVAAVGPGLLVFIGVERDDTEVDADRLLKRVLHYRVFADREGRMNDSIMDVTGELLLVPQFTLAADTRKGNRPSFSSAALPEKAEALFAYFVAQANARHGRVASGRFRVHMRILLENDGPVTMLLRSPALQRA